MFVSDKLEVKDGVLMSTDSFKQGEVVLEFEKTFQENPDQHSLQVKEHKHQTSTESKAYENFIKHLCDPNCYIDFESLELKTLRDIQQNEEISFNYLTTEYDMKVPFTCNCGSEKCKKEIKGFKYLSKEEQEELENVSPYINDLRNR